MAIIYFSGGSVIGPWQPVNELLIRRGAARLLSFAYPKVLFQYCELVSNRATPNGQKMRVMVDSGAFTAWSKGDQVDREELSSLFARLLDQYSDCCEFVLINLDVIPGRKGVDPTPFELVEAQRRSEENFAILNERYRGRVLPVFHQGESTEYYDTLVAASEYICLSPRNDVGEKWRIEWAKHYSMRAQRRYHGLATTGLYMMERVNWHSVDSARWVLIGGYGCIFWRTREDLRAQLHVLAVSEKSKTVKHWDSHINTLDPVTRAHIVETLTDHGYDLATLQNDDYARYMWNAECLIDIELNKRPTKASGGLFDA